MTVRERRQSARGYTAGMQLWDALDFAVSAALSGIAWALAAVQNAWRRA